jgi:sporadic carbohydrate cluster 2OG-Fe(II) oxygenase
MYILKPEENIKFIKIMKNKKYSESSKIYKLLKKKVRWIKINKGNYLLFNQNLPHGNVVNEESETRISMNCRYKSLFSPYADKKIGEFFSPITERVSTKIGNSFQFPF